jgi:GT2 family glycosyltransferase
MKTKLDCTIVILSYNSKKVTDTCLTKIEAAAGDCQKKLHNKIQIVVVDNKSTDGSPQMIRKKHPRVRLTALSENLGYARGNNLAMAEVTTSYILLMNSDTYVALDSVTKFLTRIDKLKTAHVLVGRAVYENKVLQLYGGYLPTPLRIILWTFGLESVPILNLFLHKIYGFTPNYYKHEGEMQWCPPVFFLLKKQVYTQTGGFDEKLFFHMVDVEWCQRMKDKGYVIHFTPTVEVIHLGGASSKGIQDSLTSDNFKGLMHFCQKHYPNEVGLIGGCLRMGLSLRGMFYALMGKRKLAMTYRQIAREV